MTAPNADIALRRVQTDDVPREKFLAAELSALSELRHCASCHRHLPWSGFRKEPDLYFGHCIQCQVSLVYIVTRSDKVTDRSGGFEQA